MIAFGAFRAAKRLVVDLGNRAAPSASPHARGLSNETNANGDINIKLSANHAHAHVYAHARGRTIRDSLRIPVGLTTCTRTRARSALCITPEQCRPRRHQPKYKSNRNTEPKGEPSRVGFGLNFKGCSQNGTQGNMVVDDK